MYKSVHVRIYVCSCPCRPRHRVARLIPKLVHDTTAPSSCGAFPALSLKPHPEPRCRQARPICLNAPSLSLDPHRRGPNRLNTTASHRRYLRLVITPPPQTTINSRTSTAEHQHTHPTTVALPTSLGSTTMSSCSSASALLLLLVVALLNLSSSSIIRPVSRQNASCHTCAPGKICAGPDGDKRCVKPMDAGQACGKDPFWVCKPGLTCEQLVCRGQFVPEGGGCSDGGLRCRTGLVCAGAAGAKTCVRPLRGGSGCGSDPSGVCADGLVCRGGVCQKSKIPVGESCRFPDAVCEDGLVCAGTAENPRCVMPMKEGGECRNGRDPFWICVVGLDCVDGKCQKGRALVGVSCRDGGNVCDDGMVCAGPPENRRCVKPMGKGGLCGIDPFWVCEAGLTCADTICV